MAEDEQAGKGRRVIFLYPHSVISDQLVQTVASQEYEVYLVKDHERLPPVLERPEFRNALLFANIDEVLDAGQWETYVRRIRESPATRDVHVGILSYNEDSALAAKYLMDIGVQAGFVRLKLGLAESTRIVLATLEATEAKGQRKYVRADCTGILNASLNVRVRGRLYSGQLRDMSAAGMACVFDRDPGFGPNTMTADFQLKLRGAIVMLPGTVAGMREVNAQRIYVILFTQPHPEHVKERIFRFIHECLQTQMKRLLEKGER